MEEESEVSIRIYRPPHIGIEEWNGGLRVFEKEPLTVWHFWQAKVLALFSVAMLIWNIVMAFLWPFRK